MIAGVSGAQRLHMHPIASGGIKSARNRGMSSPRRRCSTGRRRRTARGSESELFGTGSARVRRTVRGAGPPARGDMGTSQKSGFVWTFFMGFASVIAASPAPLPDPNARQPSNRRSFFIPYFRGCCIAVECCAYGNCSNLEFLGDAPCLAARPLGLDEGLKPAPLTRKILTFEHDWACRMRRYFRGGPTRTKRPPRRFRIDFQLTGAGSTSQSRQSSSGVRYAFDPAKNEISATENSRLASHDESSHHARRHTGILVFITGENPVGVDITAGACCETRRVPKFKVPKMLVGCQHQGRRRQREARAGAVGTRPGAIDEARRAGDAGGRGGGPERRRGEARQGRCGVDGGGDASSPSW